MMAIHDQFTHQMRSRLKITSMGLDLVRLLQDAKRFEEARTTLYSLENGFQDATADKKPIETDRLNDLSSCLIIPLTANHEFALRP